MEYKITQFVQKWIADPLQFSGISLAFQIRASAAIVTATWFGILAFDMIEHRWLWAALTGLVVIGTLWQTVFLDGRGRVLWHVWLIFLAVDCLSLAIGANVFRDIVNVAMDVSVLLNVFLNKCEPKPPQGNLKLATET